MLHRVLVSVRTIGVLCLACGCVAEPSEKQQSIESRLFTPQIQKSGLPDHKGAAIPVEL